MRNKILHGDCLSILRTLPDNHVQCCVTSPPYFGLRDYGVEGQIGLEDTPAAYVEKLVQVFREIRRVLRPDGVMFLNLGDSYAGKGVKATRYRLRKDLTPEQEAYVLSELAKFRKVGEVSLPEITTSVNETITSFASGEEVGG